MDARARYDEIAAGLAALLDVQLGQMMGMPCVKRGGKMIGDAHQSGLMPPSA